jgi:hypothetical protein
MQLDDLKDTLMCSNLMNASAGVSSAQTVAECLRDGCDPEIYDTNVLDNIVACSTLHDNVVNLHCTEEYAARNGELCRQLDTLKRDTRRDYSEDIPEAMSALRHRVSFSDWSSTLSGASIVNVPPEHPLYFVPHADLCGPSNEVGVTYARLSHDGVKITPVVPWTTNMNVHVRSVATHRDGTMDVGDPIGSNNDVSVVRTPRIMLVDAVDESDFPLFSVLRLEDRQHLLHELA